MVEYNFCPAYGFAMQQVVFVVETVKPVVIADPELVLIIKKQVRLTACIDERHFDFPAEDA